MLDEIPLGSEVTILDHSDKPYLDGVLWSWNATAQLAVVKVGDTYFSLRPDRIRPNRSVDKVVWGPLICVCGSQKLGDPGHSNWCDIVTGKRSA